MKQSLFPLAGVALCLAGIAPMAAQVPDESPVPKVLMVVREQIKEGREAAHAKTEEAWPRIYQKGNVQSHYLGMTSESGPSEAWFLVPYDSFAGMQKERAEIAQSPVAAGLEAANVLDGELRTGSRTLLSVFRGDLSYRPADAMSSMPKCRFMAVTVLRIKYGHDAELVQAAKLLIDGYEKSSSGQPVLAYQVVSGGPSGTYLLLSPMESLSSMDAAPARMEAARQAMGDRNRQHFDAIAPEVVQSGENLLFAFNPRISYLSKEFTGQDPGFWILKPAEPPKRKH
jgi:hypothetical protein